MEDTVLKIAIAGLMHDIGKFADGDVFHVSKEFLLNHADLYQPFYDGRHTHRHAVYTAAFIDSLEKILPRQLNRANWGLGDSFINLAAGHHKPSTPLQWIIAMADRVSSGWDRNGFEAEYNRAVPWKDYLKSRLYSLFEHMSATDGKPPLKREDYKWCYPLKEISPEGIFPGLAKDVAPGSGSDAVEEYRKLFESFVFALENLAHRDDDLSLWLDHFESLLMIFTSSIPASRAGQVVPDVSLYDHARATAALATALHLYHRDTETLTIEAVQEESSKKLLMIGGDFYGIQKFIFSESGEAGKNRSKILRGRSFGVSLITELAACKLCRAMGLPGLSVLLNAAGKFTILGPNTGEAKNGVVEADREINDWLFRMNHGECALGIGMVELSLKDLTRGRFIQAWEDLNKRMEKKKSQKIDLDTHGGVIKGYLDGFDNTLERPLCPFCGKRPSSRRVEGSKVVGDVKSACCLCRDHLYLGTNLVKRKRIAVMKKDAEIKGSGNALLEPIFGEFQVAFIDGGLRDMARRGSLLKYWDISIDGTGTVAKDITARFLSGYVPFYTVEDEQDERIFEGERSDDRKADLIDMIREGDPKTFAHIALKALNWKEQTRAYRGVDVLAVMKADVDQLGLLMSCGLMDEQFTISRLASLSRQMNAFFALYLPYALQTDGRFKDIYTVFAGGDDLFLIGPWNRMIDFAVFLDESFSRYVCRNGDIHLSAGITLHKPNTPVDRLSESTEEALGRAKAAGRNRVTLFSETVSWDELRKLLDISRTFDLWLEKGLTNHAMFYRLNEFIAMAAREKAVLLEKELNLEDMDCLKWYSLFRYTVERNIGRGLKKEEREGAVGEFNKVLPWLRNYGGSLRIALWHMIYNNR